jgi:hypothetical protein
MLVSFSIIIARDGAWEFAHTYQQANDKGIAIQTRDEKIANLGKRLTSTGALLSFLIKIILFGEFHSLQSNIDRLAGTIK